MITFKDPALRDFRNFLFLVWEFLGLPEPTGRQYEMADALQNLLKPLLNLPVDPEFRTKYPQFWDNETGEPCKKAILSAFRGIGKSWITAALVAWALGWKPSLNFLVLSGSGAKSDEFSSFVKRLITEMPLLAFLKADQSIGQRWSYSSFDVGPAGISQSASVRAASITGTITGGRADVVLPDDVETPNTSETVTMREKLVKRVEEIHAILKPGGISLVLGTPQCEDSLYRRLESRGYRKIIWPSRYPSDQWLKSNGSALAKSLTDELKADPQLQVGYGLDGRSGAPVDTRFTEEDLVSREASYGRSGWALQFMLDTSLADADRYPLKLRDFLVDDLETDFAPERLQWSCEAIDRLSGLPVLGMTGDGFYRAHRTSQGKVAYNVAIMAVDPSGRGADETAYAVVKEVNGLYYLHAVGGIRGEGYSDDTLSKLAEIAKQHKVNTILVEANFGQGMFAALLRPVLRRIYPCSIEEVRQTKQKETRIIDVVEPALNQHRIVVSSKVIRDDVGHDGDGQDTRLYRRFFYQLTRIRKERGCLKHDDRLDAFAMALGFLVDQAAQDADVKNDERRRAKAKARIQELTSSFARVGRRRNVRPTSSRPKLGFWKDDINRPNP